MFYWWQGNSREKSHSFFPPPLAYILEEEQPQCSWSRNKFYSISVNGKKQNHPILLGIPPGVIRKTFAFEWRPWELLRYLLWLHNLKKMLALLKLLWGVVGIPVAPETEVALPTFFYLSWRDWSMSDWRTEPTSVSCHWMLFGWKEEGKIRSSS